MRHWLIAMTPLLMLACDDAPTDTDIGTETETETESETDTAPPWSCDDMAPYQGDSEWTWALSVPKTVTLCGSFDEGRTLDDELKVKAQIQVPAGRYPLPTKAKAASTRLPVCIRTADGSSHYSGPLGTMDATQNVWDGNVSLSVDMRQGLTGGGELHIWAYTGFKEGEEPLDLEFLETPPDPWSGTPVGLQWCEDPEQEWCNKDRGTSFVVCNPATYRLETHTLEFTGGSMVLHVRMGESPASTEPAAFVYASGTLDGSDFEQNDYWKLIYRPEHHHFSRDFGVLFDAPISGACGVRVLSLDPWGDSGKLPTLDLVDCKLKPLESREVTSNVWDRG